MKAATYVILNRNGVARIRKDKPRLERGEVAVKLILLVDDKYFDSNVPEVQVDLKANEVLTPTVSVIPLSLDEVDAEEEERRKHDIHQRTYIEQPELGDNWDISR
jgi:hypothetical protein